MNTRTTKRPGPDWKTSRANPATWTPGQRKLGRRLAIGLAAFIGAGLLFAFTMDQFVMPLVVKSGSAIPAPDLLGKPFEEARITLGRQHLGILTDSLSYYTDYPEGAVAFQYPYPGTPVKPGRRVRVMLSLGSKPVEMPDVVGKSSRDAELIVKQYGLNLARVEWVHSSRFIQGIVARQRPAASNSIPENAEVVLYISDGIPESDAVMPRLIDLGLSAALDTLRVYEFNLHKVRVQTEDAPRLLPETIIDQHPDPGTPTSHETEIDLIVSSSQ